MVQKVASLHFDPSAPLSLRQLNNYGVYIIIEIRKLNQGAAGHRSKMGIPRPLQGGA